MKYSLDFRFTGGQETIARDLTLQQGIDEIIHQISFFRNEDVAGEGYILYDENGEDVYRYIVGKLV